MAQGKSYLQSLLQGEQLPRLPDYKKGWTLEQYHEDLDRYHRAMQDYLRRLTGRLIAENIYQELITGLPSAFTTKTIYNGFTVICNGDGTFTVTGTDEITVLGAK